LARIVYRSDEDRNGLHPGSFDRRGVYLVQLDQHVPIRPTARINRPVSKGFAMLDGQAYKVHFPDDPAYNAASHVEAPRIPNSVVLLATLAVLEHEFRTILSKIAPPTD
jgi:hypothetical protein